jgi:hypothetical protein
LYCENTVHIVSDQGACNFTMGQRCTYHTYARHFWLEFILDSQLCILVSFLHVWAALIWLNLGGNRLNLREDCRALVLGISGYSILNHRKFIIYKITPIWTCWSLVPCLRLRNEKLSLLFGNKQWLLVNTLLLFLFICFVVLGLEHRALCMLYPSLCCTPAQWPSWNVSCGSIACCPALSCRRAWAQFFLAWRSNSGVTWMGLMEGMKKNHEHLGFYQVWDFGQVKSPFWGAVSLL